MTPVELDQLPQKSTGSLRLTLADGRRLVVEKPDRAMVYDHLLVFGQGFKRGERTAKRARFVSVPKILRIDPIHRRGDGRRHG